jgi:TolA-binding protein
MMVRDEHPDELIHRVRQGETLSPRERSLVDRHLRLCAVCRFLELTARACDGERDAVLEGIDLDAMVARTMESLPPRDAPRRRGAASARSGGRVSSRAVRASMGFAALLLFGGAAMAAFVVARRGPPLPEKPAATVVATATPTKPRRTVAGPVDVTPPNATAAAPASDAPGLAAAPSRPARIATRRSPATATEPKLTAAELFVQASQARRDGRVAEATARYELLWRRFPTSEEGRASRAIVGRWLLDRAAYGEAASAFEDYLHASSRGVLEEEVLVGLATALERLGRGAEAAATWQRLVDEHPSTAHASRARIHLGRLRAVGGQGDLRP